MLHLRPATVPTLRRHRADWFSGRQLGREDDRGVRAALGDQRGRFRQGRVVRNGWDGEHGDRGRGSLGRRSSSLEIQLGLERGQQRRGGADGRRQVGEVAGPLAPEGHPHGRRELRRGDGRRRRRRRGSDRGRVERGGGGGGGGGGQGPERLEPLGVEEVLAKVVEESSKVRPREQVVQGGSGEDDERRLRRQGHGDAAEEDALEAPLVAVGERGLGDAREVHGEAHGGGDWGGERDCRRRRRARGDGR